MEPHQQEVQTTGSVNQATTAKVGANINLINGATYLRTYVFDPVVGSSLKLSQNKVIAVPVKVWTDYLTSSNETISLQ